MRARRRAAINSQPVAAAALPALAALLFLLLAPAAAALQLPGVGTQVVDQDSPAVARLRDSERDLREKLAASPSDFRSLLGLGTVLSQLDRLAPDGGKRVPEALQAYQRALDQAKEGQVQAFVLAQMGELLLGARQPKQAAEVLNQTLPLAERSGLGKTETYANMLLNMAQAEQLLGNEERAQELFNSALKRARKVAAPTYCKAWQGMKQFSEKQLKEVEECAEYLRRRRDGVDEEHLDEAELDEWQDLQDRWYWLDGLSDKLDESSVSFGLAAAYRQAGKEDEGWKALEEANAVRGSVHRYNPKQETENVDSLLKTFQVPKSPDQYENETDAYWAMLLQGKWGHTEEGLRPVFVVGLPRSGAALIDHILASHPQVASTGVDSAFVPHLPDLLAALEAEGELPTANISAAGRKTVEGMRRRVSGQKKEARWVVDRMLPNIWSVGFISMALPDACIVHAVRHPADQGLSCYEQPFNDPFTTWSSKLSDVAHQITQVQRMADHWDAVAPGRVLHVRYEDLVRNQEGVTRHILNHCGIPFDSSTLKPQGPGGPLALHTRGIQRYWQHARHLAPLLAPLRALLLDYERSAGLPSSQQLLDEVLGSSSDDAEDGQEEGQDAGAGVREEL